MVLVAQQLNYIYPYWNCFLQYTSEIVITLRLIIWERVFLAYFQPHIWRKLWPHRSIWYYLPTIQIKMKLHSNNMDEYWFSMVRFILRFDFWNTMSTRPRVTYSFNSKPLRKKYQKKCYYGLIPPHRMFSCYCDYIAVSKTNENHIQLLWIFCH